MLCLFQTRKTAGWLAGELSREGHQVALLSGEMQVEQRAAVIERFRDGKEKVLVTTNVCARGKYRVLFFFKKSEIDASLSYVFLINVTHTLPVTFSLYLMKTLQQIQIC